MRPALAAAGTSRHPGKVAFAIIFAATVRQLLLAILAPDLLQLAAALPRRAGLLIERGAVRPPLALAPRG